MGYAYHVVLLGLSKCGGKRFGKQLAGGPRIDGLNNTNNNIINMDHKEVKVMQSRYRPGVAQRVPGS